MTVRGVPFEFVACSNSSEAVSVTSPTTIAMFSPTSRRYGPASRRVASLSESTTACVERLISRRSSSAWMLTLPPRSMLGAVDRQHAREPAGADLQSADEVDVADRSTEVRRGFDGDIDDLHAPDGAL